MKNKFNEVYKKLIKHFFIILFSIYNNVKKKTDAFV